MVFEFHKKLVEDIDTFLENTGMGQSYFGKRAAGNSEVVQRLKSGRTITGTTEKKLRDFMKSYPRGGANLKQASGEQTKGAA